MGVKDTLEEWLTGSVIELSVRECPTCGRRLADEEATCPDCEEEPVEVTEYVSVNWQMD